MTSDYKPEVKIWSKVRVRSADWRKAAVDI